MRIYTVYESNDCVLKIVSIKEGFNWAAFIFSLFWAVLNGLWFWSLVMMVANVCVVWVFVAFGGDFIVQIIAFFGLATITGCIANDIKRQNLVQRGFKETAILLAEGKEVAIARYIAQALERGVKIQKPQASSPL